MNEADSDLDGLNRWMVAHHLHGYWMQAGGGPGVQAQPHLWKGPELVAALAKAGELVSTLNPIGSEMPALRLSNPEQRGVPSTVSVSFQILVPGAVTPTRPARANQAYLVLQAGRGATCRIEGEPFPMEAGDVIACPIGAAHSFRNDGAEAIIVLEASDLALRVFVGANINRREPVRLAPEAGDKPPALHGALLDGWERIPNKPAGFFDLTQNRMKEPDADRGRPPARYSWKETSASISALRDHENGSRSHDGLVLRYTSPADRGPTFPTFSSEIELLTPGQGTTAHRHNSTVMYLVLQGSGSSEVAGERLGWSRGDIFSVPPWTWHRHECAKGEEAILFAVDDWPAMTAMGFFRLEERARE
jgi:gentisate 1,2-dioxygenase